MDVRRIKLRSYRQHFALVQQDTFLFDGTVRDNIAYGHRGASMDEIEEVSLQREQLNDELGAIVAKYGGVVDVVDTVRASGVDTLGLLTDKTEKKTTSGL